MKLTPLQYEILIKQLENIIRNENEPRSKLKDFRNLVERLFKFLVPRIEHGKTTVEKMKYIFKKHPEHRIIRKEAEGMRTELNDIIHDIDFSYIVNHKDVERIYSDIYILLKHFLFSKEHPSKYIPSEKVKLEIDYFKRECTRILKDTKVERDNIIKDAREAKEAIILEAKLKAKEEAEKILNSIRKVIKG